MSFCNVLKSDASPEAERNASAHIRTAAVYKCNYLQLSTVDADMLHACCIHSYPCVSVWACYCLCVLDCSVYSRAEGKPLHLLLTPWHWRRFLEVCEYIFVSHSLIPTNCIFYYFIHSPLNMLWCLSLSFLHHSQFLFCSLFPSFLSPLYFLTSSLSYFIFKFFVFLPCNFLSFSDVSPSPNLLFSYSPSLSRSLSLCLQGVGLIQQRAVVTEAEKVNGASGISLWGGWGGVDT